MRLFHAPRLETLERRILESSLGITCVKGIAVVFTSSVPCLVGKVVFGWYISGCISYYGSVCCSNCDAVAPSEATGIFLLTHAEWMLVSD